MLVPGQQRQQNIGDHFQPVWIFAFFFLCLPRHFLRGFRVARVQFGNDFRRKSRIAEQFKAHVEVEDQKDLASPAVGLFRCSILFLNLLDAFE